MTYVVRHGDQVSSAFRSLIGVLTGDTLSPMLWNIYFSDLDIPIHNNDVLLNGLPVSHVEQADDVAIWS
ncbi:hypothetical protein F5051DRAFT_303183, partial [Lentinula edodes]